MNEMINRYGTLASWVYDLDKPIGRSFGDVEFYRDRLADCKGPILEPAVGNGRVLIPLLEAGLMVEGFDASDEMLRYCQQHCQSRDLAARLQKQRFEDFSYARPFQAIIIPAGSFQLITDSAAARAVLKRFYDHLLPNGRLIVDLDPISHFFYTEPRVRHWHTNDGDRLTLIDRQVAVDFVSQTTTSRLRYEHWRDDKQVEMESELFNLRWWGVVEFELALREAGFTDIVVSGNYQHGRPPQNGDTIISFEAFRKPA